MAAALFDMDRTLVRKETASLYVRYVRSLGEASWRDSARVFWWVAQYTLGVIDGPAVAARALRGFQGMPESALELRCAELFRRDVVALVCDAGRRAVEEHRARGELVAIVTGATPYMTRPLAEHLRIEHIVTSELELGPDLRFTGRLIEPLCYGDGKLSRARDFAARRGFRLDEATFYSDSYTDLPLLEAVRTPVAVNPDPRLARLARRRGWRVERW